MDQKQELQEDLKKVQGELQKAQEQVNNWNVTLTKLAGVYEFIQIKLKKLEEPKEEPVEEKK